jgi:nucleotide-binding universal stress UspA family protein
LIKRVLVAVDGSENSDKALKFAIDMTEKYDATITILNISEPPIMGTVPQEPWNISREAMATFTKDLEHIHENILSRAVTQSKLANSNLKISSKLREGNPAVEIVAEAKDGHFDVVVVGHKGVSHVKELLGLGGISEKVAHSAPCTVIIVR